MAIFACSIPAFLHDNPPQRIKQKRKNCPKPMPAQTPIPPAAVTYPKPSDITMDRWTQRIDQL